MINYDDIRNKLRKQHSKRLTNSIRYGLYQTAETFKSKKFNRFLFDNWLYIIRVNSDEHFQTIIPYALAL